MLHSTQLVGDQHTRIIEILRARLTCDGAFPTAIPGLQIVRKSRVPGTRYVSDAARICYVAQGAKAVFHSGRRLVYNSSTLLVLPVSVPLIGEIVDARPSRPMLSMSMSLNLEELASTLREIPASYSTSHEVDSDCIVRPITVELLDALCRYVGLLSEPQAIPALAPAIRREIYYRLLVGISGASLRALLARRAELSSIGKALAWFRQHACESVSMRELADRANMSQLSMFKAFRRLTSMSPVQFQKQLRLQEARRMLLAGEGASSRSAREWVTVAHLSSVVSTGVCSKRHPNETYNYFWPRSNRKGNPPISLIRKRSGSARGTRHSRY